MHGNWETHVFWGLKLLILTKKCFRVQHIRSLYSAVKIWGEIKKNLLLNEKYVAAVEPDFSSSACK